MVQRAAISLLLLEGLVFAPESILLSLHSVAVLLVVAARFSWSMILRFLRRLVQVLIRLWSNASKLPFIFMQRHRVLFGLLKSWFTSEGLSSATGREDRRNGASPGPGVSARKCGMERGQRVNSGLEPRVDSCTNTVSCSLHPYSYADHAPPQPEPSAPSTPSTDAQSSRSIADGISIRLRPPQSPSSAKTGEEGIHVVGPMDSPTYSDGSLEAGRSAMHDEHYLEAPTRRPPTMSATPNPRPRSMSPSKRSSVMLRPVPSTTSFRLNSPSQWRLSRPSSPLARSLRPAPSRASIRSQFLGTKSGEAPSMLAPEPEPLPIIEPDQLPEEFADPENRVWTMYPEQVERGVRKFFVAKNQEDIMLEPLTMRFEAPWEPPGWKPIVHPEGQLYFWHEEKRIITEAYLYDENTLKQIYRHLSKIENFLERVGVHNILGHHDLVLDLSPTANRDRGGYVCGYYFVNHKERSIFWLQQYPASGLDYWRPEAGHKSKLHLRHEIEAQYWFHCQLFPTTLTVTLQLIAELRDILLHNIADTMTSPTSTAPYSHEDLNRMLGWVNSLKKNLDILYAGSACLVGRLMFIFVRERFLHFYGEPGVRLNRGFSVYGTVHRRTILIRMLSPVLFAAPLQHLMALEKIWVDEVMHEPTWKILINKFNKQWEEFILFATVMLNANVAFLAIQSIDEVDPPTRRPAQIMSYLSAIASLGSIIIGLLLIKMNRVRLQDTAPDAIRFIEERTSQFVGLEILAILYSLPFALLMWGMIAFVVAFCLMCFQDSNSLTRGVVGAACVLTAIMVGWSIWIGWDKNIHLQPPEIEPTTVLPEKDVTDVDTGEESGDKEAQTSENVATAHHPDQNQTDTRSGTGSVAGSQRRIGSPTHDLQIHAGAMTPSRDEILEHRRMWDQLNEKWKGLWSGQLNLGLRWTKPRTSGDSGATAVAV